MTARSSKLPKFSNDCTSEMLPRAQSGKGFPVALQRRVSQQGLLSGHTRSHISDEAVPVVMVKGQVGRTGAFVETLPRDLDKNPPLGKPWG